MINIYKASLVIIGIVFPPIFIGFVNWDLWFISTVQEWPFMLRGFYATASLISIGTGIMYACILEVNK